jgi:hypothetical protein
MPEMLNLGLADPGAGRGNPAYELDLGRVLRRSFSVSFSNVLPFYLVGLAVYSPALLLLGLAAVLPVPDETARLMVTASDMLGRFLGLVLAGALAFGVIENLRGRQPAIGQTVAVGLRSGVRVLVVSLVSGIATLVGLVLCIVPGIIVYCMLWVAVPVAVVERAGVMEAMDRSRHLTAGTRLGVFAVNLVMGVLVGAVTLVVYGVAIGGAVFLGGGEAVPTSTLAAAQLAGSLLLIPLECLQAASAAVGYHDLRVHREGAEVDELVSVFE